jgi:hypothetical protein
MVQKKVYARFTGYTLLLGGLFVVIGMAIRPLVVEQNFQFQVGDLLKIAEQRTIWIVSYQVMVFGLFLRLMGLVSLGTTHADNDARAVLYPGIAVCGAAILVNALSAGYFMHIGFWGADELKAASDSARNGFLTKIQTTGEYMMCLERMGKMFFSLGLLVTGVGLVLGRLLPRWLGISGAIIGMAGMMALFALPLNKLVFIPFDALIALWFVVLGLFSLGGQKPVTAGRIHPAAAK